MNRLADESSPYLRQHAGNPVDWYPWGDEAFERARADDRPVLLSIGYSACHWCHVMAHESFEDPDVARVMNDGFVNIKVDREERPDVDAIYMEATQAMTGGGGWPMTVFLTPDRRPFFAGTYFPKRGGYGRPGFLDVLAAVGDAWANRRGELDEQAEQLTEAVRSRSSVPVPPPGAEVGVGPDTLARTAEALVAAHDPEWGGFGRAPKFPMTSNLEVLLRAHAHSRDDAVLRPVLTTLDAMASGGIYDHLGGGFARYSVDAFWMVPHFEKMLYDNALIPRAYVHAWQVTGEARYGQVVEETVAYVLRDLGREDGGLYSAEDADSEGEEGRFYVWRPEEIRDAGADAAIDWYGVTAAGNFEGSNILHRPVRGDLLRPPEVEEARRRLFAARAHRVRPGLDDKVVTEWNAMWVATAAEAGAAMGHDAWVTAAAQTAAFLLAHLRREDGRWLRAWHPDGGARHLAYAVDYAHLVDAFTRLAEATGAARWIDEARAAADAMLDLFWDDADGGLFTTGVDGEALLVRSKDVYDGATPSANSVAALALARLGALTGHAEYRDASHAVLRMLHAYLTHQPTSVTVGVATVDFVVSGATEIVVSGDRADLVGAVHRRYLPNSVLAWGEPYRSPLWEGRERPAAYVCRDFVCGVPAETEGDLGDQLDAPV
ncbi:MAG TPA: thioredoxin domain-containing protein [Acidimicrobiales bacterium]|nr:thioredoxin domain-containing protein [Acidimicrobiales bacterium]